MSETLGFGIGSRGMSRVEVYPDRPPRFADSRLDGVFQYWNERRGDRPCPARADIDPLGLPPRALPYVSLLDVIPGTPRDYRIRLIGTAVVAFWGEDATGRLVRDMLAGTPAEDTLEEYDHVVEAARPHHAMRRADWLTRHAAHYERLALPLAADGHTVDMLLTVVALY